MRRDGCTCASFHPLRPCSYFRKSALVSMGHTVIKSVHFTFHGSLDSVSGERGFCVH
jgi:hypothetical protein